MTKEQEEMSPAEQNWEIFLGSMVWILMYCGMFFVAATFFSGVFQLTNDPFITTVTNSAIAITFFIASATIRYVNGYKK